MTPIEPKNIRVRMAPSPTGFLHIGTARTALFNYLFARHTGGTFVLRIEDTDTERSKTEHETTLLEGLHWLGINWDEGPDVPGPHGPYRQSERTATYRAYLEKLLANGHAYFCYCTKEELDAQRQSLESAGLPPKYSGTCRNLTAPPEGRTASVIRLKVPEVKVAFTDLIRGKVEFDAALLGDIVIARSLDSALYHFAVVIDDYEMKISHIIRGEDHLANTPKHILIQQALGFPEPIYAHIPLILNADRSKMSKRKNKASLLAYKDEGYLPGAMVNFMAMLGWHPKGEQELFSMQELIQEFDISRVQKAGAIFNPEKLEWLNAQYIKKIPVPELADLVMPFLATEKISAEKSFVEKVLEVERDRMKTLQDFALNSAFFFSLGEYDTALLAWKDVPLAQTRMVLERTKDIIEGLSDPLSRDIVLTALDPLIQVHTRGNVLWPLRVALSGKKASPDPLIIAEIIGKAETIRRIGIAIEKFPV